MTTIEHAIELLKTTAQNLSSSKFVTIRFRPYKIIRNDKYTTFNIKHIYHQMLTMAQNGNWEQANKNAVWLRNYIIGNPYVLLQMSVCMIKSYNWLEATKILRSIVATTDDNLALLLQALVLLGLVSIKSDSFESACGYLLRAYRLQPKNDEIRQYAAASLALVGRKELALQILRKDDAVKRKWENKNSSNMKNQIERGEHQFQYKPKKLSKKDSVKPKEARVKGNLCINCINAEKCPGMVSYKGAWDRVIFVQVVFYQRNVFK
ncbi:hypothetical protein MGLY_31950 [Neomoorella glycerini]|uniref:Uncharacterized protein n=1 Tax=Neomoorella glycerini TaxID=55779 RepID=A0A6I5ZUV4_9FIRM|nr:hypothetical protein [Moorella glycerini]QGP93773.1 hypothetical protein MGLY_31950 [Moorella glycerini]